MRGRSDDAGPESFQVAAFGAVGHVGVVSAWAGAVEDLEFFAVSMGGADDEFFEVFGVDEAGAGKGDEEAAGFDDLEGEGVEVAVFEDAFLLGVATVDEFWGVEDDGVPLLAIFDHLSKPGEGVGVDEVDAGLIVVGVLFGLGDGFFLE